jgi:hypothetical protein
VSQRRCYDSVDAMLAAEALSGIAGRPIRRVRQAPLVAQASAWSGSGLTAVETDAGRFILKRFAPAWDYFMRVTGDTRGREALVWSSGLLDRLPPELGHACLACCRDGDGWAILMRDVGHALLARPPRLSLDAHDAVLDALAAFHAAFWGDTTAADPAQGFCAPWHHYHVISPDAAASDPEQDGVMPRIVRQGWDALPALIDAGLARQLLALTNDPQPLVDAFATLPQTVVHADARPPNIGIEDGRVLLIDWALAGPDVALLDAVWYVTSLADDAPTLRDASLARYGTHLQRRLGMRSTPDWWQPMLDLSLLGGFIRRGWIVARAWLAAADDAQRAQHRSELDWWEGRVPAGMRRLE